jgi:hypothetical protein
VRNAAAAVMLAAILLILRLILVMPLIVLVVIVGSVGWFCVGVSEISRAIAEFIVPELK